MSVIKVDYGEIGGGIVIDSKLNMSNGQKMTVQTKNALIMVQRPSSLYAVDQSATVVDGVLTKIYDATTATGSALGTVTYQNGVLEYTCGSAANGNCYVSYEP